jgi:RNA polymerase subunit RPABC4/transcription elongation factor Spt4
MAVNQVCSECKSVLSVRAKACKRCGFKFGSQKKYKVVVKGINGNRTAKVLNDLRRAKKLEGKLKTQAFENQLFGFTEVLIIDKVWLKYISWSMQNKESWRDERQRWKCHIASHLKGKKMSAVSPFDVEQTIVEPHNKWAAIF